MNTSTKTVHLNAAPDQVFGFLSKVENLPKGATNYCTEVKREGDDYKVVTQNGDMFMKIDSDVKTGVVDMAGGPQKELMAPWPARVAALPDGTSLFVFTCLQMPGVSDEEFAQQCTGLDEEFEGLQKLFA